MGGRAKKPEVTAQEIALERRQQIELDAATAKTEKKFKALTRNKLGAKSLLVGSPSQTGGLIK